MEFSSVSQLKPDVVLAGKYRIERVLGQGGMGIVASAYHIQLEQRVALKLMLAGAAANAEAVSRFMREARAAARLTSEHVARVFDVGSPVGRRNGERVVKVLDFGISKMNGALPDSIS